MITVGQYLKATEGMNQEEIVNFYETYCVPSLKDSNLYRYDRILQSDVEENGQYKTITIPPAVYEFEDREIEFISSLLMKIQKEGSFVPKSLLEKFDIEG